MTCLFLSLVCLPFLWDPCKTGWARAAVTPGGAAAAGMSRDFGAHLEESPCLEELPVSPGDATQLF